MDTTSEGILGMKSAMPTKSSGTQVISEVLYAQGLSENHGPTYDGIRQINP